MSALQTVEHLPAGARRRADYGDVRAEAQGDPTHWYRLPLSPMTNRQAHTRATDVRRGSGLWAPRGQWEACVARREDGRGWDTFVRYVEYVEQAAGEAAAVTS